MSKNIPVRKQATALFEAILCLKTTEECYAFFDDLCTVAEVEAIVQRFDVAQMLAEKRTYNEIEQKTGASTATISRINKCLMRGEGGYQTAIERMKGKQV